MTNIMSRSFNDNEKSFADHHLRAEINASLSLCYRAHPDKLRSTNSAQWLASFSTALSLTAWQPVSRNVCKLGQPCATAARPVSRT